MWALAKQLKRVGTSCFGALLLGVLQDRVTVFLSFLFPLPSSLPSFSLFSPPFLSPFFLSLLSLSFLPSLPLSLLSFLSFLSPFFFYPPHSLSPSFSHLPRSTIPLGMAVPCSHHTYSHLRGSISHRSHTKQLCNAEQRRHEQRQCHSPHGRTPATTRSQRQPRIGVRCRKVHFSNRYHPHLAGDF